jgi:hypothetical protein
LPAESDGDPRTKRGAILRSTVEAPPPICRNTVLTCVRGAADVDRTDGVASTVESGEPRPGTYIDA